MDRFFGSSLSRVITALQAVLTHAPIYHMYVYMSRWFVRGDTDCCEKGGVIFMLKGVGPSGIQGLFLLLLTAT